MYNGNNNNKVGQGKHSTRRPQTSTKVRGLAEENSRRSTMIGMNTGRGATGQQTMGYNQSSTTTSTGRGSGAAVKGYSYIQQRTEMIQQNSKCVTTDRAHSNPFHQAGGAPSLLTHDGIRGQHTPNFQLGAVGENLTDTPV